MNRTKKYLVLALALMTAVVTLLAGCGSGGGDKVTDMQQNVTVGKRVFVDDSGVVFYGYRNLICTAVLKDGEISEFVPEGGTTGDIYAMAVYNDELYVSARDGLFKYPLAMFTSGEKNGSATTLMSSDHCLSLFNHFEIFEDKLFYLYGTALCCIPTDGGDETEIADEVVDFEVTDKGIYYTNKDGDMVIVSPDLKESREAGNIGAVDFTPGGMNFYYRSGSAVGAYSAEKEEAEEVKTEHDCYEYCQPWSNGSGVLYNDDDFVAYLNEGGKDKEVGKAYQYPDKANGVMFGDHLIFTTDDYATMGVYDLAEGTYKSYELATEMKEYLDKMGGGKDSDPEPQPQTGSGDYDMTKGMAMEASEDGAAVYFYMNDYVLMMPNKKTLGHDFQKDSMTLIYTPAADAGYGGRIVTIKAYDMDDDSYKNIPNYHVAGVGRNVNKRFIAIYPSDVQYDPNDGTQEAEYMELYDHARKIGEGAANSPFYTQDSD